MLAWLRATTNGDQLLTAAELGSNGITTSSAKWASPYLVDHSASVLHVQLDGYNNTGAVFKVQFANDDVI